MQTINLTPPRLLRAGKGAGGEGRGEKIGQPDGVVWSNWPPDLEIFRASTHWAFDLTAAHAMRALIEPTPSPPPPSLSGRRPPCLLPSLRKYCSARHSLARLRLFLFFFSADDDLRLYSMMIIEVLDGYKSSNPPSESTPKIVKVDVLLLIEI
jgi:hypothetical protein